MNFIVFKYYRCLFSLLITIALSSSSFAQQAGFIDYKKWKLVIPVASSKGDASEISGKKIKKCGKKDKRYKQFFKINSNNTIELRAKCTGVNEEGSFQLGEGQYSATEFVELVGEKGKSYWSNVGNHVLKTRMKCYKVEGVPETYVARIVGLNNEDSTPVDKLRVFWKDGYILAEVYEEYYGGVRYKKTRIGEVGENMFSLKLHVTNGNYYVSVKCERLNLSKKDVFLVKFPNTEATTNQFRVGNYYKNDQNESDGISVQIKYIDLKH